MKTRLSVRDLAKIFDWHVGLVAAVTLGATWACLRLGVHADLPFELIAIAVVFPTAFGIGAAHRRREEALSSLANLRGSMVSIFFAWSHWPKPAPSAAALGEAAGLIRAADAAILTALTAPAERLPEARKKAWDSLAAISAGLETLKSLGVGGAEISRANQFLNAATREFERLCAIADYRTSDSLRGYSKVFLNILPVLFAPYYAHIAYEGPLVFGYAVAFAFALVLVGLDNVQDGLENPFDGIGPDDVRLREASGIDWLAGDRADQPPAP